MKIVQCWDDGVATGVRLVELLRRHGARATFNLNAGLHQRDRSFGWHHQGTEVWRLGRNELCEVYQGFAIANHTLTHPHLDQLPADEARQEIGEGRERLQALFDQPVRGFVYPFGSFNDQVAHAVRDAGHVYARSTRDAAAGVDTRNAMAVAPRCHFLASDFRQRLESARPAGASWFWGHSYELLNDDMWAAFEASLCRLCAQPGLHGCDLVDLLDGVLQSTSS